MGNTAVKGYTDVWGKHGAAVYDIAGPASYTQWTAPSTGGQQITAANLGLRSVDFGVAIGFTVSGTYAVVCKTIVGGGSNPTKIILIWYPIATIGVTQVSSAVNLSAETIRLFAVGG